MTQTNDVMPTVTFRAINPPVDKVKETRIRYETSLRQAYDIVLRDMVWDAIQKAQTVDDLKPLLMNLANRSFR